MGTSQISQIFRQYREALAASRRRYGALSSETGRHALQFYHSFFKDLLIPHGRRWGNSAYLERLRRDAEHFFGTSDLNFVAIDGTCLKDPFQDFLVFFGASYGVKGRLNLGGSPPRLLYERWSMEHDVSMVAYVPVPFAELEDVVPNDPEDFFVVSDEEKVDLAHIHTRLMELAEVYLAYNVAASSAMDYPRLILLDRSLSSIFSAAERGEERLGLIGYPMGGRRLEKRDALVALAHPFQDTLGIPSTKYYSLRNRLIAELERQQRVDLRAFAERHGLNPVEVRRRAEYLSGRDVRRPLAPPLARLEGDVLSATTDIAASWRDTVRLFEEICYKLFRQKDPEALMYEVTTAEGMRRRRWMSPEDVYFLIAVGLRALIEVCWEKRILLVGIAKDSTSGFLSRHYLGVARHSGAYEPVPVETLPWTMLLGAIASDITNRGSPEVVSASAISCNYSQGVRGQGTAASRYFACYRAKQDAAVKCWNSCCIGCCDYLSSDCDCLCLVGDYFCVCGITGFPCAC